MQWFRQQPLGSGNTLLRNTVPNGPGPQILRNVPE